MSESSTPLSIGSIPVIASRLIGLISITMSFGLGTANACAQSCGDLDAQSCCVEHATPACDDLACCSLVCGLDAYCCTTSWDALCVDEAFGSCGLLCNEPPANDHCEERITITDGVRPFDNTYADTDGLPAISCGQLYNDVWFNYEATCDGLVVIQARQLPDDFFFSPTIAVYAGCDVADCPPLTDPVCNFGGVTLTVAAGECFKIRAGVSFEGGGGASDLKITCYPTPVNDDCTGRIPIGDGETSYYNYGADTDGLPTSCGQINEDVWFNYDSTCDGVLRITAAQLSDEYTFVTIAQRIAVYTGCEKEDCPPLSEIACGNGQVLLSVEPGTCYKIRVGGLFAGFPGNGTITIECLTPAANDQCAQRVEIFDGDTSFDASTATTDGLPTACGQIHQDLWFNYTATCTGQLVVYGTAGPNSGTIPYVVLYDCETETCVPSIDLACGNNSLAPATVPVTEGDCIKIRVGSPFSNVPVSGTITIACLPAIENDNCADRIDIVDGPTPFHLFGATTDGPPACSFIADDIWFNYTATCDGVLRISRSDNSNIYAVGVAYVGLDCPFDQSNQIACGPIASPFIGSESLFVEVESGEHYKIRIGGFGQEFAGTLMLECLTSPSNDNCEDRDDVSNGTYPIDLTTATTDGPLTTNCFSFQNDIWFNYTADCNGVLTASAVTNLGAQVAIYDGCDCPTDDFSELTCNFGTSQWPVIDGNCYKIRIGAFGSGPNSGTLTLSCSEAPANDLCENRIEVFDGETPIDLTAATLDGSPFSPCVHEVSNDIWFNYTATCDGAISVFASSGFFSALPVEVYQGCDTTDCLPAAIPTCGGVIDVTAGACYKFRVMTPTFQTAAPGTLAISCATPAANDDCELREVIDDGVTAFDTNGATNDGPEAFSCAHIPATSGDVWFNYTATCTGMLNISLAEDDPFFITDHYVFVYAGCECPTNAGSEIACGNEFNPPAPLSVVEGDCYKIRISSGFQQRGVGTITLSYADTDGDSTPDCQDDCRLDPDKIEPGQCGCGVPDTDTDGDSIANCADSDDDNDGIPDDDKVDTDPLDPDSDDDGVLDGADCAPLDETIYAGAPCDDGNPCTVKDAYDKDCNCAGAPEIVAPEISCPPDIIVHADAGGCDADLDVGTATATHNCSAPENIEITGVRDDEHGDDLGAPYEGTVTITWTATDESGNSAECTQTITVNTENEMVVDVQLEGVGFGVSSPFTRCITFELHNCTTFVTETIQQVLTFSATGLAEDELVHVPCGEWECITARDPLHTLRRTIDPITVSGTQYAASFTGAASLRGGNLNAPGSNVIDIFDFGLLAGEFGNNYGTADTDCSDRPPHADASGDGVVFVADYTFITNNFLAFSDPDCCAAGVDGGGGIAGGDNGETPVIAITVAELDAMGLGHMAAGDLNNDGWLDPVDMQLFAQGVWPTDDSEVREVTFSGSSGGSWFDAANWSDGLLPDANTNVTIDVNVHLEGGEAFAADIAINSGAMLSVADAALSAQSVTINGGSMLTLDVASTILSADTLTIHEGAMLAWNAGMIAADVVSSGAIDVGQPVAQLILDGEFTQLPPGILHIDIAGELDSMHDALIVTGPAQLGGTLQVRLLDEFVPAIDVKITAVIEAQLITGQFEQVIPPALSPGMFQHLAINETALNIIYSDQPLLPADLNADGIIGSADLAELLAQWGACNPAPCSADFKADGTIDAADLAQILAAWSTDSG